MSFGTVFGWSIISHFSGNGVPHLLHFEYIKTSQYPLVELAGAASITPSSTWDLINYWHMHSHLSNYLDTVESRTWIKTCQLKTQKTGKLAGERKLVWKE